MRSRANMACVLEDRPGGTVVPRRPPAHWTSRCRRRPRASGKQSARLPAGAAELPGLSFGAVRAVQPPSSPRGYWEATVRKMKKTFGAQFADEDVAAMVRLPGEDLRCRACGGREVGASTAYARR